MTDVMPNDAWVEAVARTLCEGMGMDPNASDSISEFGPQWKHHTELARAAIATLVLLVERDAMIEGARIALGHSVEHLRECCSNAMENGYSDHAEGVGEAADLVGDLDHTQIIEDRTDDR